jgi:putative nucleotidyltransferase with HDIG domain
MFITLNNLLFALSRALDFVENELLGITTNHGKRTAYISTHLCKALGCTEAEIFDMAGCAVLHDNALTSYMLAQSHKDFDSLEQSHKNFAKLEQLKAHTKRGEENAANFPFLGETAGIILYHHENWNGTGYSGLKGKNIPLRAAILRLADNMDLSLRMGNARPELVSDIRSHALKSKGTLYSPKVVDTLLSSLDENFINNLSDANIDATLTAALPDIDRTLSTCELLRVCQVFAMIIDAKSHFTQTHSQGLAKRSSYMGKIYGLDQEHCDKLTIAAYLHDVGKLATPLSILEKPGPLDPDEWKIMREHVAISLEILGSINGMREISDWACNHHEKLDGSGYPRGLTASELSFESRLMGCCDVYQALTESRPYRAGMSHEKTIKIMREMADDNKLEASIVERINEELADYEPEIQMMC